MRFRDEPEEEINQTKPQNQGVGRAALDGWGSLCKGCPRKPLAEVILWSTPLRATSSVLMYSKPHAVCKSLKTLGVVLGCPVGIASLLGKIYFDWLEARTGPESLLKKTRRSYRVSGNLDERQAPDRARHP